MPQASAVLTQKVQSAHQPVKKMPFGLQHYGPYKPTRGDDNNYTYNGKETIHSLGLNWLDYGARWYDPAVARWWGIDPLAEKYAGWSGYNYVIGNPVILIDPDGMDVDFGGGDKPKTHDNGENSTRKPWDSGYKPQEDRHGMDESGPKREYVNPNNPSIGNNTLPVEKDGGAAAQPVEKSFIKGLLSSFQDFATVSNLSDFGISLKPEHGSTPISLAAHSLFFGEIDGIAAPHIKTDEVFKVCDYNVATVTNTSISVTTVGNPAERFVGAGWQAAFGGWASLTKTKSYIDPNSNMGTSRCPYPCLREQANWKPLFETLKQ